MSVYMPCDIRGPVSELSLDLYERWGAALAALLPPGDTAVVGGDVRPSTPAFQRAFVAGARRHAGRVVDLGTVPTPMVYFAQRQWRAGLAAVVTASHSPPQINGLKWVVRGRPPVEADVRALRERAERTPPPAALSAGPPSLARLEARGEELAAAYAGWLVGRWRAAGARLRLCVDPGNGCWAGRAAGLLRAVFPTSTVLAIHDEPDGRFPHRNPDSARPAHLTALARTVRAEGADAGLAFDGDGDRLTVLDEQGQALTAEETAWLLIGTFASEWAGRVFVHDVKLSPRIGAAVTERGGRVVAQRSGHAFIRNSMLDLQALFGAEISGHYFYGELAGGDDALYSACRLVGLRAEAGQPLSRLRQGCPPIHATGDLRLPATPEQQRELLARVAQAFAGLPLDRTDGLRIHFGHGWALVRASVTAAELTFRFEGDTPQALQQVIAAFTSQLGEPGAALRQRYTQEEEGRR